MTWRYRKGYDGHAPMRIVAHMDEPIVYYGDLIHIDSAIAFGAFRDLDDRTRARMPPISAEWPVDIALPLSRWACDAANEDHDRRLQIAESSELWGWCASAEDVAWSLRSVVEVRKKPDLQRMGRYSDDKSTHLSTGALKAYDLAMPSVFAHEITWWARGDVDKVRALLTRHVPAIGKKRNAGNGTVREWVVEATDVDRSVESDRGVMRRMPVGAVVDGARVRGAIRPPYFHASRVCSSIDPVRA